MKRCLELALFLAAGMHLSASFALADGLIRDGIGAISIGRGGTNIAHSDNGAVLLDNPAGIANMSVPGFFEIGFDGLIADLDYSDPENAEVNNDVWPCGAPHLTYVRKSCDGIWAYGIGVYGPAGFCAKYDMNNAFVSPGAPVLYKSVGIVGKVLPGVAVRLTDRLTAGATVGLAVSQVELEGPFFLQTTLPGAPALFDMQTRGTTVTGSAGLQYQVSDQTMVGVSYTEQSEFSMDGDVRATLIAPFAFTSNYDATLDITWPRSLGVGVKHDLNCRHRVSCDVIWYDWSSAFDELTLTLTNPNHPLAPIVGPTITEVFPMNWKDTVSMRLGYEWMATDRDVWRLGYVYHDSPVPSGTLNPFTDGVLEHAFSLGLSRSYSRCLLNLAYQYSFSPEQTVGTSDIAGGDFSNSTFQAQAHWASASLLFPF